MILSKHRSAGTKPAVKKDLNETLRDLVRKYGTYTILQTFIANDRFDLATILLRGGTHVNGDLTCSETPLHLIVAKSPSDKSVEICNLLLSRGANVNAVDQYGWTPLHYAAKWRRKTLCELLVRHSANVNAVSKTGETPLHIAAKGGNADTVRMLLKNGAAVNAVNNCGEGPLHVLGRKYGHEVMPQYDMFASLLEDKDASGTPYALQRSWDNRAYPEVVKMLVKAGAEIDAQDELGESPLHVAVASSFVDMAQLLVSKGCNVNAKTNNNFTPLHFAVRAGHFELVEFLLKKGADTSAVTLKRKLTPFDVAVKAGLGEIAILLFQKQPKLGSYMNDINLLHFAIKMGCYKFVKEMLENSSDRLSLVRGLSRKQGCASLHVAAKHGRVRIVRLLLSYVVDVSKVTVDVQDIRGNSPLYYANSAEVTSVFLSSGSTGTICPDLLPHAVRENRMDLVKRIFGDGANIEARDENGMTALHIAALTGSERFVKLLIERGADVDARDTKRGYSALHFAASRSNNTGVIETLLIGGADVDLCVSVVEELRRNAWGECSESSDFCGRFGNLNTEEFGDRSDKPLTQCSFLTLCDNNRFQVARPSWEISGVTPLMVAVDADCAKNVEVLLEHGADINIAYKGRSPLQSAHEKVRSDMLIRVLQIHIIRLRAAGLYINRKDLPSEQFYRSVQYLTTELEKELSEMKTTKIEGSNAFFYDFLMKSPNSAAILYHRENIKNILDYNSLSFLREFPEYGNILRHRLRSAETRWSLLNNATFQLRVRRPLPLPDLCLDEIIKYLSNWDLYRVIIALAAPK